METRSAIRQFLSNPIRFLAVVVGSVLLAFLIFSLTPWFGYVAKQVDTDEIGIVVGYGQFEEVKGSGIYHAPLQFGANLITVKVSGFAFNAEDPEVLTKDLQRIGVQVSGKIFLPGVSGMTEERWLKYKPMYQDSEQLINQVNTLARQAMKVCVGGNTFEQAAVGNARNDLANCIDDQLTDLASEWGVYFEDVVVPDIIISEASRVNLDALTTSRQLTALAVQDAEKAKAQAALDLAVEQGKIQVEEGKKQEALKWRKDNAKLEEEAVQAEAAVIEATKNNELLSATAELEIARANRLAAEEQAKADLAPEIAKAELMQQNPAYVAYLQTVEIAKSLEGVTWGILPEGMNPIMTIGQGVVPTLEVAPD